MAHTQSEMIARLLDDPIRNYPSATVACFDATTGALPRRSLAGDLLIRYLQSLAQEGAPALLIGASTGQGHLRTLDELREWFQVAAQAETGSAVRVALLRPEDGKETARPLMTKLAEWGYHVAMIRPATGLNATTSLQEIVEGIRPWMEAAAEAGLAVGLYSISNVSGAPLTPEAVARLMNSPGGDRIVAVKVTEENYESSTGAFLHDRRFARLKIVQGWDPHIGRALREGYDPVTKTQRCGITSGCMSFSIKQFMHMMNSATACDWVEVDQSIKAVATLFAAMQDDPTRFANLQRAKWIMGLGGPLTSEVTSEQTARVLSAIRGLAREPDRQRIVQSLRLLGESPFDSEWGEYQ